MPPVQESELRFSPGLFRWFSRYLRIYFARNFTAVRLQHGEIPRKGPLIIYGNHPSWWDPIFAMLIVSLRLVNREGYGPMEAGALEQYGMFRRLGAFPVELGTHRGARAFLQGSREALRRDAVLFVMAEGRFTDPRTRPVRLSPGLAHLAATHEHAMAIPLAFEYPFWDERKPEALARFGKPFPVGSSLCSDPGTWQPRLEQALQGTMDSLAKDARSREAARFTTLLQGSVGVGGLYDRWRWLRATLGGKPFDAAHGARTR